MAYTSVLHLRLDRELKAEGMATLASLGMTASDAVRLLFERIVEEQGLPPELKEANAETQVAIEKPRLT